MFHGIQSGWQLIVESIKIFNKHPHFLMPLILTWLIYAPIVLYLKYFFDWGAFDLPQTLLIVFIVIFIFAFLLAFSCSMLLEIIQQLENGEKTSISRAFNHSLKQNTIKILPIVFVWTIVWFLITIIQALLSKDKRGEKETFSAENAAKTLAGYQSFSLSRAFFQALQKGIRMVVFLILPAIAWENLGFVGSVKKGIAVFKSNLSTFVTGFVLTGLAAGIVFLPPTLLIYISGKMEITLPDWVWVITIIYIAFAWSYSIYLEQMFTAELYLWNYKWEKEVARAQAEGRTLPQIIDVPKPSILDEVRDLVEASISQSSVIYGPPAPQK